MALSREQASHPGFILFGNEARTRAAFAFIPDPEIYVSKKQIAEVVGKPVTSLGDAIHHLRNNGLLSESSFESPGPMMYKRIDHPLWAVFETAKIVFTELGVEISTIAERTEEAT